MQLAFTLRVKFIFANQSFVGIKISNAWMPKKMTKFLTIGFGSFMGLLTVLLWHIQHMNVE
jgi:hypothetical protein